MLIFQHFFCWLLGLDCRAQWGWWMWCLRPNWAEADFLRTRWMGLCQDFSKVKSRHSTFWPIQAFSRVTVATVSPLRVDVIYFRIVGLHFQKFNLNYFSVRFLHFMKCKFLTQGQFRRTWLQSCGPGEGVHQDCPSNRGGSQENRNIVLIYLWRWPHLLFACWRKITFCMYRKMPPTTRSTHTRWGEGAGVLTPTVSK